MTLATVVTANAERRAQALRDYPGVQVVADPDRLWRNAADHDLVVISTPNRSHVPLALAALRCRPRRGDRQALRADGGRGAPGHRRGAGKEACRSVPIISGAGTANA